MSDRIIKGMRLRATLSGRTGTVIGFHSCPYTHTPMYEIQWDDDGSVTSSVDPGWMPYGMEAAA
jgi:hypothetical protein